LGIDLGSSRTGVALSDAAALTCSPLAVIKERDQGMVLAAVVALADTHDVEESVVGLPRPLG